MVTNYYYLLFKKYGLFGILRLSRDLIFTRLFNSNFRLLRHPYYIRNVGCLVGGDNLIAGPGLIIDILHHDAILKIGTNVCINHNVHIGVMGSVDIGDDVLIASKVYISDHSHGSYSGELISSPYEKPNLRKIHIKPVIIEASCWLGENVVILPGVKIGTGSIIGAGSIVTKDIPSYSIAVGNPAKIIKVWDPVIKNWVKYVDLY